MNNELTRAIQRIKRCVLTEEAREEMREAMDRRQGTMFVAASLLFFVVCVAMR